MASINTFDEMGLNKKREYEAKLKREGIVAEGTVSAGNMEEEEGWVERFRKIPMVKLLRESKCVANDSKEQDLADIMTEINKHEWDKIEDFIQSELDRAREGGRKHMQGWECPKCGSVYSPLTFECTSCKNSGVKVRTSDKTSGYDNTSYLN